MTRIKSVRVFKTGAVLAVLALLTSWGFARDRAAHKVPGDNSVWLVFFSSKDCDRCGHVKDLIDALSGEYPLKVKTFDITRQDDYALFGRIEAIHARKKFAVPLVLVGDSILMGEKRITARLEKTVSRLTREGGSGLPYLGSRPTGENREGDSPCPDCERKGRPPSIEDEWRRIKNYLNKFF
jgi:hypothetical protein